MTIKRGTHPAHTVHSAIILHIIFGHHIGSCLDGLCHHNFSINMQIPFDIVVPIRLAVNKTAATAVLVNDTLKLSHLPRSMFKKRGVKVSHC